MRLSVLVLPIYGWEDARAIWQQAERWGCHGAYTYDHLAYEGFEQGPWFGAVPTLAAAATATERLRLGTLITSPNFRHPVPLAKDLVTLDALSAGRLSVGLGAGSSGLDATVLGHPAWTPAERAERFEEFVVLLDQLLTHDVTTFDGKHYAATEVRMLPGCTQRPRLPFTIAATGRRGMGLAARYGQAWVTCPYLDPGHGPDAVAELIRGQLERLDGTCRHVGRDPATVERVYLTGYTDENPLRSRQAFDDMVGRYDELGITEMVIHWPVPGTRFANDLAVLEAVANARFGSAQYHHGN